MEHFDERLIKMVNDAKAVKTLSDEAEKFKEELKLMMERIKSGRVKTDDLNIETEKRTFFDSSFTMYIPGDLMPMPENIAKIKYPSEVRPKIIFTNKKDTVNIGLNYTEQELLNEEVYAFRDAMKDAFTAVNPSSEILDSGELEIDGTNIGYYTFPNFAMGGQLYNLFFVLSLKGKALVCNFNCLKKDMLKWKLLFYGIMNTIGIKTEV
jgi:hypothetical protein